MNCTNNRLPYGKWRLLMLRRVFAPQIPHLRTLSNSCTRLQNPQNESSIPPSQRLPQSPLITHPRSNQADKARKLDPGVSGPEPLAKNPWAQALASPMRFCFLSGVRMPRALMGNWGLVRRPKTEHLYLLPVDYLKSSLQGKKSSDKNGELTKEQALDAVHVGDNTPRRLIFHMANLIPLFRLLTKPLGRIGGKKPPVSRLIPYRWKHPQGPITQREEKQLVWMNDMPEYLLKSMRRDLKKQLVSACQLSHVLGASNGVWNSIEMKEYSKSALLSGLGQIEPIKNMECGAVIIVGPQTNGERESWPEFVTVPQIQRGVPVFDLSVLLSESDLAELRQEVQHFQQSALFFRPNNPAMMDLMMALWKLKRYLVEDKQLEEVVSTLK